MTIGGIACFIATWVFLGLVLHALAYAVTQLREDVQDIQQHLMALEAEKQNRMGFFTEHFDEMPPEEDWDE